MADQIVRRPERYYQPSGQFTLSGLVLTPVIGAVAAVVLGFGYGYLIEYVPYVFVRVLLTIAFGLALAWPMKLSVRRGKLRSRSIAVLMGGAVGVVGLYAAWVAWIHALIGSWTVDPTSVWAAISRIHEADAFNWRTNPTAWVFWGSEAATIVGLPSFVGWYLAGSPFCERCETWAEDEYKGHRLPAASDPEALVAALESSNIDALGELNSTQPGASTRVSLSSCPNCKQVGYLTVSAVQTTTDKKGRAREQEKKLAKALLLDERAIELARKLTA